ncbi:hypothetical protein [Mycobacterium sp. 1274761.0]|uniref:DUF7159 family protein n=1 Tax=Mycobacterium sp. 1274761.0 TaxID=1834077 RepID=UPI000802390B|nr:hypothetical protein [Mycobacterium sp. 1274761.0]OBK78480.1 hypothetical protein A5651_02740 [Mycobacterium sp. 1274761.0]
MDLVLGLSVTSTAVRWVLVEGVAGDGDAVDRGVLDIVEGLAFDAEALLTVLLDANEAVIENGVHAVGVTWTPAGEIVAGDILEALQARGLPNAIAVSEVEAAEALAGGIADIAGYQSIAVCVFEPDYQLVAVVNGRGVTADPQNLPDDVELASSVIALDLNDRQLDAIFVVGSADLVPVVSAMGAVAAAPVISSAEADMAMARGAAVASALAVYAMDGRSRSPLSLRDMSRTTVLTSVVVGAAVTLVVSLSVVLGLQATSDSPSETTNANATGEQLKKNTVAPEAKAALAAPKVQPRPAAPAAEPAALPPAPEPQAPPIAETMVAAAPPAPEAVPEVDPPAATPPVPAYVPPAPVYTPPAPAYTPPAPVYVPPAQPQVPAVQPQPRLRDKIIERIPIINRFHEPQPMYPTP